MGPATSLLLSVIISLVVGTQSISPEKQAVLMKEKEIMQNLHNFAQPIHNPEVEVRRRVLDPHGFYDKMALPYSTVIRENRTERGAVEVKFGTTLQSIQEVNMKEGTIRTVVWLNLEWTDKALAWNQSQFSNIYSIRVNPDEIWTPDIEAYNVDTMRYLSRSNQAVVSSDGSVLWVPPYMLTTTCKMDMTWFPFDDQHCDIKFGSWTRNGWEIDLKLAHEDGMDISGFVRNEEFDLLTAPGERHELTWDCCPEPYLDITYSLHIRRRSFSIYTTRNLPSSFLACLIAVSSCLLSSKYNHLSKFFLLVLSMCIEGALGLDFAANSFYNTVLSAHSGIILLVLILSILSCSLCGVPLESLCPFLRFIIKKCVGCFTRNQGNKEMSSEEVSILLTRVLDGVVLVVAVVLLVLSTVVLCAQAPAFK